MTDRDVADQLVDELEQRLAGPVRDLLGLDLAQLVTDRIGQTADALVAQLADPTVAGRVAIDLMHALHGVHDPDPGWWRTSLGRACASALAGGDDETVTHAAAAAMLGVTRGTVAQLVHRGTLDRAPEGGVSRASVLRRLAR